MGRNDLATPIQPGIGGLSPKTLDEAMKLSSILADSSIVPKDYQGKPGNVLVAIQWGQEIGLPPLQAMQNIAVINGRPSIWGDAVLALVRGSGLLDYINEEVDGDVASCTVKRVGEDPVTRTFSMEDAKTAGLAGKQGPWQQYPKRMLQMRARGFAIRDVFPDVLRGVHIAEEAQDEAPMRDVTPQGEQEDPKASRTEALKKQLGVKPKDEKPRDSLADVVADIEKAESVEALKALSGRAAGLPSKGDVDKARAAYTARLATLKNPPSRVDAGDTPETQVDPEVMANWVKAIGLDIESGASESAIREMWAPQIDLIEKQGGDLAASLKEVLRGGG